MPKTRLQVSVDGACLELCFSLEKSSLVFFKSTSSSLSSDAQSNCWEQVELLSTVDRQSFDHAPSMGIRVMLHSYDSSVGLLPAPCALGVRVLLSDPISQSICGTLHIYGSESKNLSPVLPMESTRRHCGPPAVLPRLLRPFPISVCRRAQPGELHLPNRDARRRAGSFFQSVRHLLDKFSAVPRNLRSVLVTS